MKFSRKLIFSLFCVFILITFILYTQVFADVSEVVTKMKDSSLGITTQNWFTRLISTIIAFIQVAVVGAAIIRFTVVGIKYFTVTAASDKAESKGQLLRTFIGGVIAFFALQFARIIFEIFNS